MAALIDRGMDRFRWLVQLYFDVSERIWSPIRDAVDFVDRSTRGALVGPVLMGVMTWMVLAVVFDPRAPAVLAWIFGGLWVLCLWALLESWKERR